MSINEMACSIAIDRVNGVYIGASHKSILSGDLIVTIKNITRIITLANGKVKLCLFRISYEEKNI